MSEIKLRDCLLICFGAVLYALVLNMLIIPHEFGEGGITGVTLLLYYMAGIETSLSSFVLNGILIILAYRFLSKLTVFYTFLAVAVMSLTMHYTTFLQAQWLPLVPSACLAGLVTGLSMALVIYGNGSTAGSDIIALLCNKYFNWKISTVILLFDLLVVTPLFFRIGLVKTFWTVVMVVIISKSLEWFLQKLKQADML
ncbi:MULTISPECIES: YitT family protein [Streptococcus]|uniref:YitT family protein n=2 Tax=Streptococcus ruminantium TaxID=1917441 RepID=A0ABU1B420_9STRE|nr:MULTISPECIES: YitT family protein [Streptococcus]MDQ8758886.1 YitT family protein [Streptococcus ruminantium]MDQ8764170.1 YitT family protein [Streptococcus ruminantium]MDQ8766534.1 YitT family protein [Streptococcus ruminantium]MDQ8768715.1 YitT family protein [Streptococcus ruminantium]MDQ8774185.1 YitT family protein [Streptococcus ruminantium]